MVAITENDPQSKAQAGEPASQTPTTQFLLMPPREILPQKGIAGPKNRCPPLASRWKKGQSGNPTGKRAIPAEVRDAARTYTHEAIGTLVHWMRDRKDGPTSLKAAVSLLERGWGKAPQLVGVVNATEKPSVFTITIDEGGGNDDEGGKED